MKEFLGGFLVGVILITAIPAFAVEATLSQISVRDLYAATVAGGVISVHGTITKDQIDQCFKVADAMLIERNK